MDIRVEVQLDLSQFEHMEELLEEELLSALSEELITLGDECQEIAWTIPSTNDGGTGFSNVTGALRSSIGSAVYRDGFALYDNYKEATGNNAKMKPLTGGNRGVTAGRQLAEEVANTSGAELSLVVTAGMPYASILQDLRGRDVLASAWLHAKDRHEEIAQQVVERVREALSD